MYVSAMLRLRLKIIPSHNSGHFIILLCQTKGTSESRNSLVAVVTPREAKTFYKNEHLSPCLAHNVTHECIKIFILKKC